MKAYAPALAALGLAAAAAVFARQRTPPPILIGSEAVTVTTGSRRVGARAGEAIVRQAVAHDLSQPLATLRAEAEAAGEVECEGERRVGVGCGTSPAAVRMQQGAQQPQPDYPPVSAASAAVEQTRMGARPAAVLLESFDGHGFGQVRPHGVGGGNNPSDNSMAVGPDHIVETVNSVMAVYTRKGELFDTTGAVLFGPIGTNVLFSGFGGECELRPNGDAVVRYDQLAGRWLYVMPLFRRAATPAAAGEQPPYGMCYALSAGPNPLGPYYRYYYERDLFPDYPRPAIWPDGYYVPTSTGDDVIEKHACVIDRAKMLRGEAATEQCIIIRDVNFLNNADIDGWGLPPAGAPNIMMATGGTQLREVFQDDGIYAWEFHVDWENPSNTKVTGPVKIAVAPYNYLCNGQLTRCVPQPDTDMRLDAQGDKIMQRLVYRNIDGVESIVAVHSVATAAGGGGVRWYEFRLDGNRDPVLYQQGTYAPEGFYRWMASPGMDRAGNIGIGYSFGGTPHYAGQRFAGRLTGDPLGELTFRETVMVEGKAAQTNTLRWEDYTQTSLDPVDDCTFWYVGDYLKAGAPSYTTRIGSFRLPGCLRGTVSGTAYFDVNHNGMREANEPGLAGWTVEYTGTSGAQDRIAPPSGTLTTSANGDFSIDLPADPAYFQPTYRFTARAPTNAAWTRVENGTAYSSAGPVPMANLAYTVRVRDRDAVTYVNFGHACTVANSGGERPEFWLGDRGRATLAANDQPPVEGGRGGRGGRGGGGGRGRGGADAGWRNLLNFSGMIVNADGSRFQVQAGTFDEAYAPFRSWMQSAPTANASHALSVQLAATTLNIAYGTQDANVTVLDPVANSWAPVATLLTRIRAFMADHPSTPAGSADRAAAEAYLALLASLNGNTARVTPTTAERCPR